MQFQSYYECWKDRNLDSVEAHLKSVIEKKGRAVHKNGQQCVKSQMVKTIEQFRKQLLKDEISEIQ